MNTLSGTRVYYGADWRGWFYYTDELDCLSPEMKFVNSATIDNLEEFTRQLLLIAQRNELRGYRYRIIIGTTDYESEE